MSETVEIFSLESNALVRTDKVVRSNHSWKKQLTQKQYQVCRLGATECAFTGDFYGNNEKGVYKCVCCGADLFVSDAKFKSGTGWPSFFKPVHEKNLRTREDKSIGTIRVEVMCTRCDAHLGHVFEDGPRETGLRYCINSAALKFEKT